MRLARHSRLRHQLEGRLDLDVMAVPMGYGAGDHRAAAGPRALLNSGLGRTVRRTGWRCSITTVQSAGVEALIDESAELSEATRPVAIRSMAGRLAKRVEAAVRAHRPFLVLGGDHSIAMGTWAGAARALRQRGPLGLVWIDAHMDAHTPATTPSGNWHGMPVAHLLGQCATAMSDMPVCSGAAPALRPEHICLVGPRSFEPPEVALLSSLGVRVIDATEIHQIGLAAAISRAISIASSGTAGFGVSLDLDVFDPVQAPGVGTAVPGGLDVSEMIRALRGLYQRPAFVGLEIVEFNPAVDEGRRTARVALDVVASALRRSVRAQPKFRSGLGQKRPRAVMPA